MFPYCTVTCWKLADISSVKQKLKDNRITPVIIIEMDWEGNVLSYSRHTEEWDIKDTSTYHNGGVFGKSLLQLFECMLKIKKKQ
jgi:hypothetical protein